MVRHSLFVHVSIYGVAIGFALLLSGCDRVAYEAKNSQVGKKISDTYRDVTRLPLQGQIEVCRKEELYEKCMRKAGYRQNPAWFAMIKRVAIDLYSHDRSWTIEKVYQNQRAIDQYDAIPRSHAVPYWVKTEDCRPNYEMSCD